jgi:hypothetical protein
MNAKGKGKMNSNYIYDIRCKECDWHAEAADQRKAGLMLDSHEDRTRHVGRMERVFRPDRRARAADKSARKQGREPAAAPDQKSQRVQAATEIPGIATLDGFLAMALVAPGASSGAPAVAASTEGGE